MATVDKKADGAAAASSENSDIETTTSTISERKLLTKLDLKLLPPLCLLYLLSFLDRSNVGNARLEGLVADLHISPNQYLTGLTLYFIGYVLFEVPANIVLKRTSPRIWLPTLTLAWGVVATLMGVTQNRAGFFIVRFFLGVTECGLFPGVVYYLSMWYKRRERQYRVALFFSCASLAGAFGGILAWGIAHMRGVGGYNGWRWIFILEGLLTIIIAVAAYGFVINYPATAKFLTSEEKRTVLSRLQADSDAIDEEQFQWSEVINALKDYKVWLYCFAFHTMSLPLYTLSLFLPTIIRDLGYTAAKAQLLTVPPYALATIFTVLWAVLSERAQKRAPFIITTSSLAAIGYIILITNTHPSKRPGVSYVGTFFAAAGIYPSTALSLTLPAVNVGGQTKRATATALQISIGNLGAVLGTQLYRAETSPRYVLGHSFALGYLLCNVIVLSITWWALSRENRVKDRALQQLAADGPVDSGVLAAEGHKADHTAQESKVGGLAVNGDAALTYKFTI